MGFNGASLNHVWSYGNRTGSCEIPMGITTPVAENKENPVGNFCKSYSRARVTTDKERMVKAFRKNFSLSCRRAFTPPSYRLSLIHI